ncbi:MAG: hypothetical protein EXR95_02465 [Gemmatimonadetes bacterium]|nr:hypothetical protein [Gemmatimonadota bacterium]
MRHPLRIGALLLGVTLGSLALGASGAPLSAQAQAEAPPKGKGPSAWHPEALKAIDRLKSPFCPGFMLEVCPSPQAAALRDSLEMLAEDGVKADSIVEWMLARHGEEWRALPPARGRSLIAWLVPPIAAVAGVALVIVVLRRLRRPSEPPSDEISADGSARLDAALRELETEEEPLF